MLLEVTHLTRYNYQPRVDNAQHVAYLTPARSSHQELLQHQLTVTPRPTEHEQMVDIYGNTRSFFSIQESHTQLSVLAHSIVRTQRPPAPFSETSWEQVQERFRYHALTTYNSATEFVFASPCIPIHQDFQAYALPSFAPNMRLLGCAQHLMQRIYADFSYETDSTEVSTPTLQALHQRSGVCQDFAHIMVACFRAMGLPARYVSGYLLTHPLPGQARLIGCDASHAWASVFLPDDIPSNAVDSGQWVDFDPTNNRMPDEDYVTLATGRDFGDVSPLRGVIQGGGDHTLEVEVTVMPLSTIPTQSQSQSQ
jgi:transglutaminase-like putative cysteine protease